MGHRHHGKSSATFLDSSEILSELNFRGDETFMDAGCGDGYISIKAIGEFLSEGTVYAVDNYDESIKDLEAYKQKHDIENLIAIEADLTKGIPSIENESVDVVLMLNVFHGFKEEERDNVIEELKRIIKNDGRIVIMDFKPIEMTKGPPIDIRLSPEELESIFMEHNLKKTYLNDNIGEDVGDEKSHYLIIFEKE